LKLMKATELLLVRGHGNLRGSHLRKNRYHLHKTQGVWDEDGKIISGAFTGVTIYKGLTELKSASAQHLE
jgi:hypothetical protein